MCEDDDRSSDPPKPDGIHPLGQLDARFPVTYRESVPQTVRVLTEFFTALSERDLDGIARTVHFPFGTYEGVDPVVVESDAELREDPPKSLNVTGSGESHVPPGSFDILDGLELHLFYPVGAVCSLTYSRYGEDGGRILQSEGVYAVTNNDGEWGIELMSTIVTPDRAIGTDYEKAEAQARRLSREWMLGYTRRNQDLLNATRQYGRRIRIALSNPRANARNARDGTPMDGYPIEGIESRLSVSELTPERLADADADFEEFADLAGGGVGQWEYTLAHPDARILHSSSDKVHSLGGYIRYTADDRVISETHSIGITTYKDGRWGRAGGFGAMMFHDYTNDLAETDATPE